jgi:hypothetical protein
MGGDAVALATTGTTMIFEDYEAPLGVDIRYEFGWSGASTSTMTVTVPPPEDPAMLWIKDPGQPARNVCLLAKATGSFARKIDRGVYPIKGTKYAVTSSDVRQARESTVSVYTRTADEENALDWILDTGATLLLQGLNLGSVYASIGDTSDDPVNDDGSDPWRLWPLPYLEQLRPVGGMQGTAGRTWQTVRDANATWQVVLDGSDSWLDVLTGGA